MSETGTEADTDTETIVTETVAGVTLLEDEEVLHDLHASWSNWWKSLTIYLTLTVFSVGLLSPLLLIPYLQRKHTRYVVTSERIVKYSGLFSTSSTEYRLDDLREIQTTRSFGDRLFGKGTVRVSTDPGDSGITLGGIGDAERVVQSIRAHQ